MVMVVKLQLFVVKKSEAEVINICMPICHTSRTVLPIVCHFVLELCC